MESRDREFGDLTDYDEAYLCPVCHGSRWIPTAASGDVECPRCGGTGSVDESEESSPVVVDENHQK